MGSNDRMLQGVKQGIPLSPMGADLSSHLSSFTSPHKFHFLEHGARLKCKSIWAKISKNKWYPSWIFLYQQGWFLTHIRDPTPNQIVNWNAFHIYQHYQATWLMPWLHLWYIVRRGKHARCCNVGEIHVSGAMQYQPEAFRALGWSPCRLGTVPSLARPKAVDDLVKCQLFWTPVLPKTTRSWRLQQSRARYSSLGTPVPSFKAAMLPNVAKLSSHSFAQMFHAGGMQCCRFWVKSWDDEPRNISWVRFLKKKQVCSPTLLAAGRTGTKRAGEEVKKNWSAGIIRQ